MTPPEPSSGPAEPQDPAWYRRAFRAPYLDLYAHRDEADAARAVAFMERALGLPRGLRLLDLACGAGRHLGLLWPRVGWAVGVDLSRALLAQAREYCDGPEAVEASGRRPCALVQADMRRLPFAPGGFDLVINLFTSFGYFEPEEENRSVLAEVARALAPGGRFLIDHINGAHLERSLRPVTERVLAGGVRVTERRRLMPSPRRVVKEVLWIDNGGARDRWTESVRVYRPEELEALMAAAGLRPLERFGDWDASPLATDSPRMILLARREDHGRAPMDTEGPRARTRRR